ncbi:hypothetical protein [Embleya scabrispora]|uniref:hypothetical protein n=1 Tax=Embleya scabrispora TaxID=159449 RepID=UPI00131A45F9|nr:hypothetical protein [Embleya scabrispora]MYS80554.1 hypothetical protein [Streptomyces sp. SID5474]
MEVIRDPKATPQAKEAAHKTLQTTLAARTGAMQNPAQNPAQNSKYQEFLEAVKSYGPPQVCLDTIQPHRSSRPAGRIPVGSRRRLVRRHAGQGRRRRRQQVEQTVPVRPEQRVLHVRGIHPAELNRRNRGTPRTPANTPRDLRVTTPNGGVGLRAGPAVRGRSTGLALLEAAPRQAEALHSFPNGR